MIDINIGFNYKYFRLICTFKERMRNAEDISALTKSSPLESKW